MAPAHGAYAHQCAGRGRGLRFVMCGFMVSDSSRGEEQIVSYFVSGNDFLGGGVIFKDAGVEGAPR